MAKKNADDIQMHEDVEGYPEGTHPLRDPSEVYWSVERVAKHNELSVKERNASPEERL